MSGKTLDFTPEVVEVPVEVFDDVPKILPKTVEFLIPGDDEEGTVDQTFVIGRFCFAKTLMMMETLGELAERIDVASMFVQKDNQTVIGIDSIVEKVPVLLRTMRPTMVKLLALTLMKNRQIEEIVENEDSLQLALKEFRSIVYRLDTSKATELLQLAIERMGIADIRKAFPSLLAAMSNS